MLINAGVPATQHDVLEMSNAMSGHVLGIPWKDSFILRPFDWHSRLNLSLLSCGFSRYSSSVGRTSAMPCPGRNPKEYWHIVSDATNKLFAGLHERKMEQNTEDFLENLPRSCQCLHSTIAKLDLENLKLFTRLMSSPPGITLQNMTTFSAPKQSYVQRPDSTSPPSITLQNMTFSALKHSYVQRPDSTPAPTHDK